MIEYSEYKYACKNCTWTGGRSALGDRSKVPGFGNIRSDRTFCPVCGGGSFTVDGKEVVILHPEEFYVRIPAISQGWKLVKTTGRCCLSAVIELGMSALLSATTERDGELVVVQVLKGESLYTYLVRVDVGPTYDIEQIRYSNEAEPDSDSPLAKDEPMAEEIKSQLEACNAGEKVWKKEGTLLSASDARKITEDFINEITKEVLVGVGDVAAYGKCEFVYDPPIKLIEAVEYKLLEKLKALGYSVKRLGKVGESHCAYMLSWEK